MKKQKKNKTMLERMALAVATVEVNTTCPFTIYQPKLPEALQKQRKQ